MENLAKCEPCSGHANTLTIQGKCDEDKGVYSEVISVHRRCCKEILHIYVQFCQLNNKDEKLNWIYITMPEAEGFKVQDIYIKN